MYHSHLPGQEEFSSLPHSAPPPQAERTAGPGAQPQANPLSQLFGGLFGSGGPLAFLQKRGLGKLDKGDILLILILLYLYWESEDDEWLIILGLLFLFS